MIEGEDKRENRTVERILRGYGDGSAAGKKTMDRYQPFLRTDGYPEMGFSIFTRSGGRHLFFYHNLENVDLQILNHGEYLRFSHRGKAVSLRGRGLHKICDAILEHTLHAIYEFSSAWGEEEPEGAIVDRIQIDSLDEMAEQVAANMQDAGRRLQS